MFMARNNESLPNTYVESVENGIAHIRCYSGSWLNTAVTEVLKYLKENPECKVAILNRSDSKGVTQYVIQQGSTFADFQEFLSEKNAVYEEISEIANMKAGQTLEVIKAKEEILGIERERISVLEEIAMLQSKLREMRAKDEELVYQKSKLESVELGVQRALVSEAMDKWGNERASEILAKMGLAVAANPEPEIAR
jgi:hypothetical protein